MTLENDGYYSFTVTGFTTLPIGVIFNNGATSSTQQTVDLFTTTDKCWDAGPLTNGKYTAIEVTCPIVGIEDEAGFNWNIYPNPTHDQVNFSVPDNFKNVTVTSLLGHHLAIKPRWNSNSCQIDLSGYPSGVYYITFSAANGTKVTKAVMKY
jgi:hypothetical protein